MPAAGTPAGFPASPAGVPPFCFPLAQLFCLCSLLTPLSELAATQLRGRIRECPRWVETRVHKWGSKAAKAAKGEGKICWLSYKIMQQSEARAWGVVQCSAFCVGGGHSNLLNIPK